MRLPLIEPADLSSEQHELYEDMRAGIEKSFQGFKAVAENGALMAPWNPWLYEPKFGKPIWELTKALSASPSLPKLVREVAILVTGAKFRSAYEIYAHVMIAEQRGLSDDKIATIVAGERPTDLARDEAIAYDVASALVDHGVLPELNYPLAVQTFGEHGAAELIYLVGLYCLVSVTLNGFDTGTRVPLGSLPDLRSRMRNVRFTHKSGHSQCRHRCLLVPVTDVRSRSLELQSLGPPTHRRQHY
jgi:4-carboxymuconolactone decarboxylase